MIKLTFVLAGLTFAIFFGLMTFRSRGNAVNNSLFRSNNGVSLVNDIKGSFGLSSIGSANTGLSGKLSLGSGYSSSGGAGAGAYLPPKSSRTDMTFADNRNDSKPDLTTPLFRIFIASTRPPTSTSTTTAITTSTATSTTAEALTEESLFEMEETTLQPRIDHDDDPINIGFHPEIDVMNFDIMGRGETAPNAFLNETTPPQKLQLPATTLQPPSADPEKKTSAPNVTENTINTETNSSPVNNGTSPDSKKRSDLTLPPTTLYLPPNKEYLPPKQ